METWKIFATMTAALIGAGMIMGIIWDRMDYAIFFAAIFLALVIMTVNRLARKPKEEI